MRLINADEAEKYFYEHLDDNGMIGAMNAIKEMPTIKAEPINSKITNRERFMREISNEDLAKILKDASGGDCPCQYCIETQDTCKLKPCIEGVIEWLESPSDKGETGSE